MTRILPCLRALRSRPQPAEITKRIDAALDGDRIDLIVEPDERKRLKALEEAAFFICENDDLGPEFYRHAGGLKLIQAGGYFFERLKPEEAASRGIPVATFAMPISDSVVDHTMTLLLHLKRREPLKTA
ncbi:MAG: hypothetical protein VCF07_10625 [Nitrospinota bacterium]